MISLKILLIEDDLLTATDIKETLESAGHTITAIASNYDDALSAVKVKTPDIAIIDIKLKDSKGDGILTAKELQNKYSFPIIYLTGDFDKATFNRAKETLPLAFILKPFKEKELPLQVELAYHNYQSNQNLVNSPKTSDEIFIPTSKGLTKIVKNDIVYLKADGSYVHVFLKNESKSLVFSMNLGYLFQFLPKNFYQLSRSYAINLNYVEGLESQKIKLKGFVELLQIPEAKKTDLLKKLPIVRTS